MTEPGRPGNGRSVPDDQAAESPPPNDAWGDVEQAHRAEAEVSRPRAELTSSEDARQTKKDRTWNRALRLAYGVLLLIVLAAQLAIADYVFYLYGEGNAWVIPPEAISAWLGATVIEVIGVVVVIVRFLFSRDSSA